MKPYIFLFFFLFVVWCPAVGATSFTVMFYNVENYFDCSDDTTTNDDDFLPDGAKQWSAYRMATKRTNIARVIAAVGEARAPVLVGLCEVENDAVLRQLVNYPPLATLRYRYVHYDSPDVRGIDVALLYQPRLFAVLQHRAIPITLSDGSHSRDVLYVKGVLATTDTLHVMVCHAPSRRGGENSSAWRRAEAMQVVKATVDSLLQDNAKASVLIMGDFNDTPCDSSMCNVLGASLSVTDTINTSLYNLMDVHDGTYKYKSTWSLFDQFVVSKALLRGNGYVVQHGKAKVYDASFLVQQDATYMGIKPYRTYLGPLYVGGYSDHLPIYLQLQPAH